MAASIPLVRSVHDLRNATAHWRAAGLKIGLVPTMGALHEGHLSLIQLLRAHADKIVVSIFVNPTQFAPHEDFAAYPRTEDADLAKLALADCDLAYVPDITEMYPEGFSTQVSVGPIAAPLEGTMRPHFFTGVATIVSKLLIQTTPDCAAFGEKDYQQLLVIKRMVRDLNIPTAIYGAPTQREADGLAMSSRNAYLSADERLIAGKLNRILQDAGKRTLTGAAPDLAAAEAADALRVAGFDSVDYVAITDAETLEPLGQNPVTKPARILAAARIGRTRLIDNFPILP
ncbi:MAG: pantoate--beta-alanine ligase [Caulobacterales bacterium]